MSNIWAIILAAGESKRMGFPKMLLDFNGRTMIENVISMVVESEAVNIIIVIGAERESLLEILAKYRVRTCYNENYKKGMLSSVQCGFNNIPPDAEAVFVFQGDQPLITTKTVNYMIRAYRSTDKKIIIPVYNGKRGHPILIGMKYSEEIMTLDAGIGLRELTINHPGDILQVETEDPGILRDFDTYEEYRNAINNFR
jgi:molybdenum cofactor cytidylyltransferase